MLHSVRPSVRLSVVCLSVRNVPSIFSKSESRRNFTYVGDITLGTNNWGTNFRSKGQRSRSLWNENVKIVFSRISSRK